MASVVLCGVTLSVSINRSLVLFSPPHLIFRFVCCFACCINFVIRIPRKRAECTESGFYHYKSYGSRKPFSQSCEFLFMWIRQIKKILKKNYQNQSDVKNSYQNGRVRFSHGTSTKDTCSS